MANKMVTYVTHERKIEGELITVPACGEKCFFPKGHKGKHSAGKPEGIWAVSGMGDMYITSGFKYDKMFFAMARVDDWADHTQGWCVMGCGFTPEELVASVADTLATGEAIPEKSLLEFLAAFKAWRASDHTGLAFGDPARYQFRHYLWSDTPGEERCRMLNIVVQQMPDFGT